MKSAIFDANIYDIIVIGLTHDYMRRIRLRLLEFHAKFIKDHDNPEKIPQAIINLVTVKSMDVVPSHLCDRLG